MAAQQALYLKRKFKKNQVYAAGYKEFMRAIIRTGYAEIVPLGDLQM